MPDFQNLSIRTRRPSNVSISSSHRRRSSSVLDNANFAPPPSKPKSLEGIESAGWHGQESNTIVSSLPHFDKVKHSGNCFARFSLMSMLIKRWRPTFWIAYEDHQLLFFRSITHFEKWVSDPYLTMNQRDKLVKASVNFAQDLESGLPNMQGFKVSKVQSKEYSRDGYMYHFKLEKWFTYGPSVCLAIGGKNKIEVDNLHKIMAAMIDLSPQKVKSVSSDASSFYSSGVSDYNFSGVGSVYSGYGSEKSGENGSTAAVGAGLTSYLYYGDSTGAQSRRHRSKERRETSKSPFNLRSIGAGEVI